MKNAKKGENITDVERTFGALLRRPYQHLTARVYERLAATGYSDIRPAHGAVFRHIAPEGLRITELADRAQMTKQSMGYLVEYLREHGYVELRPDPSDGRAKIACLTPRGEALQQDALKISREVERELAQLVGEEEIRLLRAHLERLNAQLKVLVS
ncbi:MAG TPA: MarR family winged helix-turn-helix transcriptional regulator [Chthonomonadaceae bacterium]|nr:MarR family winged helix-turn-helix transcriptional regulator [Chthonomonadaceae bacterium]